MDRRLATHDMNTPASHDVVVPNRPTPAIDSDSVVESPAVNERLVSFGRTVVPGDRGLERLGPTRVAELRMRLETGAYRSPEVMTELAMRLLESGDL